MTGYCLELEIPGLTRTMNSRGHWRDRHRESQRCLDLVGALTIGKRPPAPLQRARLTLTRMSSVEPDLDNMISGFKPVIDALVRCGILVNDKPSNIMSLIPLWEPARPRAGGIRVKVEEA